MDRNIWRPKQNQRGFSLIEVLVAVFILSVGLLSVAALQIIGLKNTHSALLHSQATTSATDIIDRMRINRDGALAGSYDIAIGASAPGGSTIAANDLGGWKINLDANLPYGDGAIDCSTVSEFCVVTVQWDDSGGTAGSAAAQIALRTRL
ncbi:type IV pilus modification protein PilV [Pseudomonadota bacterium]